MWLANAYTYVGYDQTKNTRRTTFAYLQEASYYNICDLTSPRVELAYPRVTVGLPTTKKYMDTIYY